MPRLVEGEIVNLANPVLDVWMQIAGVLTDVFSLEFQIFDATCGSPPLQIDPTVAGNKSTVDVAPAGAGRIGVGHYTLTWDPTSLTLNHGRHFVRWFVVYESGGPEISFQTDFEIVPEDTAAGETYGFLGDVRDEGLSASKANDQRVLMALELASREIEDITGRIFRAEGKTILIDGRGSPDLLLDEPIIGLSKLSILSRAVGIEVPVQPDLTEIAIYNRHLRGLVAPDDRENPKISFFRDQDFLGNNRNRVSEIIRPGFIFDYGQHNVEIEGVFGYTERSGQSPMGRTPPDIRRACALMAIRKALPRLSADAQDISMSSRIKREKTLDQEYELFSPKDLGGSASGPFTGDPEIDNILLRYSRGPAIGSA